MRTIVIFIVLFLSLNINAQIFEDYKHVPETVDLQGFAGFSLAVDGEWAVVGALNESDTGAIHIYHREDGEWVYFQRKIPSDYPEHFGQSVAIRDNRIVVVAPRDDQLGVPGHGSVYFYVFTGTTWAFTSKLYNPNEGAGQFGRDVKFSDNRLFIGSASSVSEGYGVFQYGLNFGEWQLQHLIESPDSNTVFTGKFAVDGDILICAAALDDDVYEESGACSFFKFVDGEWVFQQKIKSDEPFQDEKFGNSLELLDEKLVVGSLTYNWDSLVYEGNAYYFEVQNDIFVQEQLITSSYGLRSLAMKDNYLLMGTSREINNEGVRTGVVFLYEFDGELWNGMDTLMASDGENFDLFGQSVIFSESSVLVGAMAVNDVATSGGAVYFYEDLIVGVSEIIPAPSFMMYPNPLTNTVHITFPENIDQMNYTLTDVSGKVVQSGSVHSFSPSIDMVESTGMYLLTLWNDQWSITNKLFVE